MSGLSRCCSPSADNTTMPIQSPHLAPPPPPLETLFQHYLPSIARFPAYPAFIDGLSGRTITSTQLRTDALRLGRGMQRVLPQNHISGREPAVALIFSPNSVDFPQIFFGCQSVKVITSLANAGYTANELAHQIRDGRPFIAFVHPSLQATYLGAIDSLKAEGFHSVPKVYWAVPEGEVPGGVKGDVQTYDRLMLDHKETDGYQGAQAEGDEAHDTALLCYSSGTVSIYAIIVIPHVDHRTDYST
jgi:acyl-CoA synthetase (AMP-forming)/AMP-acid ligase II